MCNEEKPVCSFPVGQKLVRRDGANEATVVAFCPLARPPLRLILVAGDGTIYLRYADGRIANDGASRHDYIKPKVKKCVVRYINIFTHIDETLPRTATYEDREVAVRYAENNSVLTFHGVAIPFTYEWEE